MKFFKIIILMVVAFLFSNSSWADDNIVKGTRLTYDSDIVQPESDCEWSPDGNYIAYSRTDLTLSPSFHTVHQLYLLPVSGGTAEMIYTPEPTIYESTALYPVIGVMCFSADGAEIFFYEDTYDTERGTVITISDTGYSITNAISVLKAINIYTKTVRTITEFVLPGVKRLKCSNDGNYIVYLISFNNSLGCPAGSLVSLNMETGQIYLLENANDISPGCFYITPDNNSVVFSGYDNSSQNYNFYKVPITGGTVAEQPINFTGSINFLSASNTGEWLLFQSATTQRDIISYSWTDGVYSGGGTSNSTHYIIYAYNLITGKLFDLFSDFSFDLSPISIATNSTVHYENPVFSPDGSKFICTLELTTGTKNIEELFVFDFNVEEYLKALGETAVETDAALPGAFAIKGNYPNPFNPTTTIEFNLTKSEKTNLSIYNIAGQRVRELIVDTNLTPGIHSILWNGKDDSGKSVSSGVYIARLTAGENSAVKSMMMVK